MTEQFIGNLSRKKYYHVIIVGLFIIFIHETSLDKTETRYVIEILYIFSYISIIISTYKILTFKKINNALIINDKLIQYYKWPYKKLFWKEIQSITVDRFRARIYAIHILLKHPTNHCIFIEPRWHYFSIKPHYYATVDIFGLDADGFALLAYIRNLISQGKISIKLIEP